MLTASGHIMLACRRRVWLPRVNSLILSSTIAFLVVKSHLAVTYIFSIGLYFLFEQGLCKPYVVVPVYADPGPVGGWQALIGLLGIEGFLG